MIKHPLRSLAVIAIVVAPLTGCSCAPEATTGDVNSTKNVAGDDDSSTDVNVDKVEVDHADVKNDVNAKATNTANIAVNVDIGGGDNGGNGDNGDKGGDGSAGTSALGDGVAFDDAYHGPIDEHATLTPSFAADIAVDSVQWIARDVVFGAPTILDDAASFDWGDAGDDGEYVLGARFGDDAAHAFTWSTDSAFCDVDCHPRAISAACSATLVMRVWLVDGSMREATGEHTSARPTCH